MLNHPTLEKLKRLKLTGMAKGLEEQTSSSSYDALSFEERLGLLVDLESTERDNRRIQNLLKQAFFRHSACLEDIHDSSDRGLDQSLMLREIDLRLYSNRLPLLSSAWRDDRCPRIAVFSHAVQESRQLSVSSSVKPRLTT